MRKNFKYNFPAPIQFKYVHDFNKIWRILPFIENTQSFNHIIDIKMVSEASWCMVNSINCKDFPQKN